MKIYVKASRAQVRRVLRSVPGILAGRASDPTGLVRQLQTALGLVALSLVKEAFVAKASGQADQAGQAWLPLDPATVARRRKGEGEGQPQILRDTGRLLNGLSPGVLGSDQVFRLEPGKVIVGTNVSYAHYHHLGGDVPGRPPQRRLWPAPQDWPAAWWTLLGTKAREAVRLLVVKLLTG